jgi:hypothetical protein
MLTIRQQSLCQVSTKTPGTNNLELFIHALRMKRIPATVGALVQGNALKKYGI